MNIVKNLNYFFILLGLSVYSQNINNSKIDSLTLAKNFDYFAHNYKFLDKNYKPNIDDFTYQKIRKDFKFYDKPAKSLQDSIQVILMGEFANSHFTRIGTHRLTYTWERISLFTRIEKTKIVSIAKKNNVILPYNFYEIIQNDTITNRDIKSLMAILRKNLILEYGESKIKVLNNREMLNFSFNNNPEVHKLKKDIFDKKKIERFVIKHKRNPTETEMKKLGIECGKENCCQKSE